MTERTFRILVGTLLLLGLYFDLAPLVYTLIGIMAFQGITNWRITQIVSRLRYGQALALGSCCKTTPDAPRGGVNFEAERALCLLVAFVLLPTYGLYFEQLWLIPWFIGFALFGAGLSGVCPMVIGLRSIFGFR